MRVTRHSEFGALQGSMEVASTLPRRRRDGGGLSLLHAGGSSGGNVIEVAMLRLIALIAVIIAFVAAGVQV